ncbi:hypothetical protein [uncultured Ruminococcus sp.]|uniref:hypothetical protein n=1 Tax=uncultured Ruminococcus sp. TaxID=165186 RepID=UPI00266C2929|nr:hypothetical protein [uncultured Ruminococcus sp.]
MAEPQNCEVKEHGTGIRIFAKQCISARHSCHAREITAAKLFAVLRKIPAELEKQCAAVSGISAKSNCRTSQNHGRMESGRQKNPIWRKEQFASLCSGKLSRSNQNHGTARNGSAFPGRSDRAERTVPKK